MKTVALILDSLDKTFPADGKIRGGANKINNYIIKYFLSMTNIQVDIICAVSRFNEFENIHKIIVVEKSPFGEEFSNDVKKIVDENNYDVVISNDIILPFAHLLIHSHTILYRNKNSRNFILAKILNFLRRKKIKSYKELFKNKNRKIFTVSERLRQDYIKNIGFKEEDVITSYPGMEKIEEQEYIPKDILTFGIATNNSINKGGFMFVLAVLLLKLTGKQFKVKMILSKSKKVNLLPVFIKLLGLNKTIELLQQCNNMGDFYNNIDCIVLPSNNEAFGLVVTEAASYSKLSLVTSTAGVSEIIEDGVNGFIFRRTSCLVQTLRNLYNKLVEILNLEQDKIKIISHNAYLLSEKLTWDNYVSRIVDALKLNV